MPRRSSSKKQENADIEQAKPSSLNMHKKSPSKTEENADVEQSKPSSKPKKASAEIDKIFSGKKRKKPEQKKADKANLNGEEKPKSMKKKKGREEDEEGRFTDQPSGSRRKTEVDSTYIQKRNWVLTRAVVEEYAFHLKEKWHLWFGLEASSKPDIAQKD